MDLLTIDDDLRAYPSAELVMIEEFKALVKRDKGSKTDHRGKKKLRATRELAYIYHCESHKSSYANYHYEVREEEVRRDVFKDWPDWYEDDIVKAAREKYVQLTSTPAIEMLKAGMNAAQKLTDYFDMIDLSETDDKGQLKYSARDLVANLGNLGKVVDGLNKLKEQVERDQQIGDKNRKSVETNRFSE